MTEARTAVCPTAIALLLLSVCAFAQAPVAPISLSTDQPIDHLNSDQLTWVDSTGQVRSVVLAHDATGYKFGGPLAPVVYGGAIRSYTYPFNGGSRTATVTTYGNGGFAGFGYVVQHTGVYPCVGDDSPLGWQFPITGFQRVFVGRHHVILRMTQNYQRNCPNATRYTPVTFDWMFSTGRDNPVYAITYDVGAAAAADVLNDDSRAPYGELNIDGDGSLNIDGVAWGDRYKFTTTAASDIDVTSPWDYTASNTIPFVQEWINDKGGGIGDAAMGLVQTQTFDQQDAGGARDANVSNNNVDLRNLWTHTSGDMNGCGAQVMPCGDDWAYQADGDSIQCNCGAGNNARLTWKTMFGFVGQTTYNSNNVSGGIGATPPGYPKKSYSVYVVLGQRTTSPVEAQVAQVENLQPMVATASTGSVVTGGPAGIADATTVEYHPHGYNHIYGALAFSASSNQLDANIAVGAGTLSKPIIVVSNYTGADPAVVLDGTTLTADVDYFASLRGLPDNELWITLNRDLTGATNHLQINVSGGLAAPTGLVATASGVFVNITWNTVPGAAGYQLDRTDNIGSGWATICPNCGNGYGDVVSGDTAYAYRVRAVNGPTVSANSVPDVATTTSFTDDPLVAGTTPVAAVHLGELRHAVDLVRALAALPAGVYTDAAAADVSIKAVHVGELRTQLDEALAAIGVPAGGYTDPALDSTVPVKAVHFQELRDRMQ